MLAEQKSQSQVIAAKANAEQVVVAAKASAQQVQVAAEADAARVKIQADAERQAAEARAAAIKALGQANADARKLEYSAFSAPGAELYAQIEIAKSMSVAFGNINGYLPQNMTPIVLGDNFTGMVKNFMNSGNRQSSVSIPAPAANTK